ncbi:hypothetical protein THAR02_10250 [Trichoderma harzianum]|uniref:AB hydrolase-1 domain-containing protein n=1 Tax=Trichoderma harzianum TaxID=5544 RepID=A0A0F9WWW9_TRIHA|nr:hypothetical protein THAR02_10250 [Trichoderma harzianum]
MEYEEHFVEYGDSKSIFYHASGPRFGPLIIFMHGWPGIGKTWYPQLDVFSSLGFRVIAPDMPGYGRSTARNVISDYSQESVIEGMLAVLGDTGRDQAIWIGHDWGCGTLWTLANTHPQVYHLLTTVDRELYPKDQFPYGPWSYMAYYEQFFDEATAWFNKDIHGFLKFIFVKASADLLGKVSSLTSRVFEDKGWMGGRPSPPAPEDTSDEAGVLNFAVFEELVAAMKKTGFAQEKPQEVNSAIARWLVEEVIEQWPSFWSNGWTKQQLHQE